MELDEICQKIADIHNTISRASVSGESILIVADAMIQCRDLVNDLQNSKKEKDG